jgi:hypothetical protein
MLSNSTILSDVLTTEGCELKHKINNFIDTKLKEFKTIIQENVDEIVSEKMRSIYKNPVSLESSIFESICQKEYAKINDMKTMYYSKMNDYKKIKDENIRLQSVNDKEKRIIKKVLECAEYYQQAVKYYQKLNKKYKQEINILRENLNETTIKKSKRKLKALRKFRSFSSANLF